jgi:hypothetical protein
MAKKDKERYEKEKADYKIIQQNRASEPSQASVPLLQQNSLQGLTLPSEIEVSLPPNTRYVPGWIPQQQFPPFFPHPGAHIGHFPIPGNMNMPPGSFNPWNYYPANMFTNVQPNGISTGFINYGSNLHSQHAHPMPLNVNYASHLPGFPSNEYSSNHVNIVSQAFADNSSNTGRTCTTETSNNELQSAGEDSKGSEPINSAQINGAAEIEPSDTSLSVSEAEEVKNDEQIE